MGIKKAHMEVGIKKELHEKTNTAGNCCATPVVPRVSPHACKPSIAENMKFFWGKEGEGHAPDESCAHLLPEMTTDFDKSIFCPVPLS